MHDLYRKLILLGNHFFEWLKTANFSTACETSTLKRPPSRGSDAPHVHPRLRKRPPGCTLDCGFKTAESPALRGFVAGAAGACDCGPLSVLKSNGFHHSENLPVKFVFSSKTVPANIAQKLPSQRCSQPLFIAFFNFSHKWPTFAFTGESGYTLAFANRIAHSGLHGETGAIQMGALLLPSDCFTRFGNPAWPGGRTANFAAFGPWSGVLPKNAESLRDSDAFMRVAVPRRRGPAGSRCSTAVSCAAPVSFVIRYHCDEGQREKFVNVTVVILFVV